MSLQDLNTVEREIITAYLGRLETVCAKHPTAWVIVSDEEEPVYEDIYNRAQIEMAIGNTGMTKIRVRVGQDQIHSTFFVHGNYEDVVSDSTYSKAGEWLEEALLKGIYE